MRGSLFFVLAPACNDGIIPAHAGLTELEIEHQAAIGDHPRACGAHFLHDFFSLTIIGSSPRMRGSPNVPIRVRANIGIIPAHAGLTRTRPSTRQCIRDHPRACGAHARSRAVKPVTSGSSPRMRGSPSRKCSLKQTIGIIPAHAGLTDLLPAVDAVVGDHPRACGAHILWLKKGIRRLGSSPRMRGSQQLHRERRKRSGIIPAHAGLT